MLYYDSPLAAEIDYRHERIRALAEPNSFEQRYRRRQRRRQRLARWRRALTRSTHRVSARVAAGG